MPLAPARRHGQVPRRGYDLARRHVPGRQAVFADVVGFVPFGRPFDRMLGVVQCGEPRPGSRLLQSAVPSRSRHRVRCMMGRRVVV
jgi:hypothetical protein